MSATPVCQLTVQFINNSTLEPSDVYIGFVSSSPPPNTSAPPFSISAVHDGSPINAIDAIAPDSFPAPGNWYALDSFQNQGVCITHFSGRIYVCYETPWAVQHKGYEPGCSVTDPNFFLRYDKMELTFNGAASDVANLTSIDYWSIPMSLQTMKNGTGPIHTVQGLLTAPTHQVTTQQVFDELYSLTKPDVVAQRSIAGVDAKPLPALVPGEYTQDPNGPAPGKAFARILGPSFYPPPFPAPGGRPVTPYGLLEDYLQHLSATSENGKIATIAGHFAGVGSAPTFAEQMPQDYNLSATISSDLNITLCGTLSNIGNIANNQKDVTMVYLKDDLLNPSGIYGGNAPCSITPPLAPGAPADNVYSWISGDLFCGLNIGALGSATEINGKAVGSMTSQEWFATLPTSKFFAYLQPESTYYNQWAATLSNLSQAYNFAYTDRFSQASSVLIPLDPGSVDTLVVVLEVATVTMPPPQ